MSYSNHSRSSWFNVLFITFLVIVSASLITAQQFVKGRDKERIIALKNAKALAGGLIAFKSDRGAYPCEYTRGELEEAGAKNIPAGQSSNAYLAQLVVTDIIDSEKYFGTPGVEGYKAGDDAKDTAKNLLSEGENGFAYVMTLKGEPLTDISSITPIVLASVETPGIVPIFNKEIYKGQIVYGCVDGSGKLGTLNKHGNAMSKGRIHMFQTGADSLFGEDFPVITFPKLAKKK